jgi:polyhydroxyalkanoate synthesis regulator phasin
MQLNKKLQELIKDYKIIFNTDEGKRVLEDLKKRSHFHNTTHVQGDSHESAYNEGQRSLVVFMETLINHKE